QGLCILTLEDRRVGGDAESCLLRRLNGLDSGIKSALAAYQLIMAFLETIEVDAESEVRRRCKLAYMFLEEQRIRTEVDEFLACHQTSGNLVDLRMQQRFPSSDGDHRRTALLHGLKAGLWRQILA